MTNQPKVNCNSQFLFKLNSLWTTFIYCYWKTKIVIPLILTAALNQSLQEFLAEYHAAAELFSQNPRTETLQAAINATGEKVLGEFYNLLTIISGAKSLYEFITDPFTDSFFKNVYKTFELYYIYITTDTISNVQDNQLLSYKLVEAFIEAIETAKGYRLEKSLNPSQSSISS